MLETGFLPNGETAQVYAIGLDVGGTHIRGGLVALPSGRIITQRILPTEPKRGGEAVLADGLNLAKTLIAESAKLDLKVLGIGIGVCELADLEGNLTSSHTIAWKGLPIQDTFSRLAPCVVESDVRAAALAEARFGAGQPFKFFTYVTVGTGISSCLVQSGRVYAGARGNALILASSPLTTLCPACGTHYQTVLEDVAAGPALAIRYNRIQVSQVSSGEEVMAAVDRGNPDAIGVVQTAGEALGVSIGFMVNVLDPEAVVVGGGLGLAGGLYWSSFVSSTRAHIWADNTRDLPILPAQLGTDAGLVGAAVALGERLL